MKNAFLFLLLVSNAFCDLSYTVSTTDVAFFGTQHADELPRGIWVDQKNGWRYVIASVGGDSDNSEKCIKASEYSLADGTYVSNKYSVWAEAKSEDCYTYSNNGEDVIAASNVLLYKVNEVTNKVVWWTIFGGPDDDTPMGIAGDSATGNIFIAGNTMSSWDADTTDPTQYDPEPLTDQARTSVYGFLISFKSDGTLIKQHTTVSEGTSGVSRSFNAIAFRSKDSSVWVTGADYSSNDVTIVGYNSDFEVLINQDFGNAAGSLSEGQSIEFLDESTIIVGGYTQDTTPPTSRRTFTAGVDELAFTAAPIVMSLSLDDSDAAAYQLFFDWSDVLDDAPYTGVTSSVSASVNGIAFDVKRGFIYLAVNDYNNEANSYLVNYHRDVQTDGPQAEIVELDGDATAKTSISVAQGNFYFPVLVVATSGADFASATRSLYVLDHGYTGPATLLDQDGLGANPDADITTTLRGDNYLAYYMPTQPDDNSKTLIVHIGSAVSGAAPPTYTGPTWMSDATTASEDAGDWTLSLVRSAPVYDTLDELVGKTGTVAFDNQFLSQTVIPVHDSPANSFTYFLLHKNGKAWARGSVYVLTEEFGGDPNMITEATEGYATSTTTKNNKIWLFPDSFQFVAGTTYYFYFTTAVSATLDIESPTTISRDVNGDRIYSVYDSDADAWTPSTDSLVFRLVATDDGEGMGDPLFIGFNNQKFEFDGHVTGMYNIYNDPWMNLNTEFGMGNTHDEKITVMKVLALNIGGHRITIDRDHGKISSYKFIVNIDGEDVTINPSIKHLSGCIDIQYRDMILITSPEHTLFIYPLLGHNRHLNTGYFNVHIHHPEEDVTKIGGILGQTAQVDADISVDEATFEINDLWSNEKSNFFKSKSFDECTLH